MTEDKTKKNSPGCLTNVVVYAIMLTAMYFAITPQVTGNFTENEASDFHVVAIRLKKGANDSNYVPYSLARLMVEKVDSVSVSFLLPEDIIYIDDFGSDLHKVTVLEHYPDSQLIEYHYGNTHHSISTYRAFKDRIEPISYRVTMHPGILFGAIVLLIPARIVSTLINAIWSAVVRKKKSPNAA